MNTMKKLAALLLALTLSLSLAACGGSGQTAGQQEESQQTSDTSETGGAEAETVDSEPADGETEAGAPETEESDLQYVRDKGTLVIGITEFEPMDYQDTDGNWIGFDADLAAAFAESLGVEPQFQVIDWDSKVFELNGKTIDVVWNGMTLTDDVRSAMECSNPYFNNAQVVIVPADQADDYQTVESVQGLSFAVESGSAGMEQAEAYGFTYTEVIDQATSLLEVSSGTADAAIIDFLMAKAMTGAGTSYETLTSTVDLNSEEYGVGFRKGSDLAAALNDFFHASYEDGTMREIAEKYNIADALIEQ